MAVMNEKSIEETLWESANKLRGSVDAAEYKHVVLGLVFLKFISDKYEQRKLELINLGKKQYIEHKDAYTMENVFYVQTEARWSYLVDNAKQGNVGQLLDKAFSLIETLMPSSLLTTI